MASDPGNRKPGKERQFGALVKSFGLHEHVPEKDRYLFAQDPPTVRFNIIGAGMMGREHMRVTWLEGRGMIHGLYDPSSTSIASAEKVFGESWPGQSPVIYGSLEEACNDPAVDGLILCTPNYTHIDVVRVAARSGKHILLEKPMATTVPDAHEIMELARDYPGVFQVGLQYRYKAMYAEAIHEALVRKSLGAIKTISVVEQRIPFLDKIDQWNKFAEYSGGTLVEKCCHYFDLINLFAGRSAGSRPTRVFATGSMAVNFRAFEYDDRQSDILDSAFVTIEYDNGVRAGFQLVMFSPMFSEEIVLCGDEGRLKAFENEDFLPGQRLKTGLEIHGGPNRPSRRCEPSYPAVIEDSGHNGATYFEHRSFMDRIERHAEGAAGESGIAPEGMTDTWPTPEDAYWSVVVGAAAEQSVATGEVVAIDAMLDGLGLSS